MIYKSSDNCFEIPIDSYANQLAWYLQWYLNRIENDSIIFSKKDTEKAKISYIPCVGSNAWYGSRNRKGTADSGIKE